MMHLLIWFLATPGCTVIERNQTLEPDTSFEINNAMFRLLLGMLLLSRCHKVPDRKKYWKSTTDTFVLAMLDSIAGNMFKGIPGNAHCRDNGQLNK